MNLKCIESRCSFCQQLVFHIELLYQLYPLLYTYCVRWTFETIINHLKQRKKEKKEEASLGPLSVCAELQKMMV